MKKWIKKQILAIKEYLKIIKMKSEGKYFGKVMGYDFQKIECKDAEVYDMMTHQPQYLAVSEAEFLERFLLNKSEKELFLKKLIANEGLRKTIFLKLTEHMQLKNEKVTIL